MHFLVQETIFCRNKCLNENNECEALNYVFSLRFFQQVRTNFCVIGKIYQRLNGFTIIKKMTNLLRERKKENP